jgi:hypothetical protein
MSFLENCFNTMLEYGEAIKSSFVKGHVSDWPEKEEVAETAVVSEPETETTETVVTPEAEEPEVTPETEE